MKILHHGLTFRSKEESDKFFIDFLGLEIKRSFTGEKWLMKECFGLDQDIEIIHYGNEEVLLEVFIIDNVSVKKDKIVHICIKVDDRDSLVEKAAAMGIESIVIPRKDSGKGYYLFIRDSSYNLYEIKQV